MYGDTSNLMAAASCGNGIVMDNPLARLHYVDAATFHHLTASSVIPSRSVKNSMARLKLFGRWPETGRWMME
jgi:hypothetical protein